MTDNRITHNFPPAWGLEPAEKPRERTYADIRQEIDEQMAAATASLATLMSPLVTSNIRFDRKILDFAENRNLPVSGPEWRMSELLAMSRLYLGEQETKSRGRPKEASNLLLISNEKKLAAEKVIRTFKEEKRISSMMASKGMSQRQACFAVAREGHPTRSESFIAKMAKNFENKMSIANRSRGARKPGRTRTPS